MIMFETNEQKVVVEWRLRNGYEFIGYFLNMTGVSGRDVGIIKGSHRMHINALGYDSYVNGTIYQEVK